MIIFGICFLIDLSDSECIVRELYPFRSAVLLSVPCGLMGSSSSHGCSDWRITFYLQTGLIMLIGLLAKTAILLTEYAAERRKAGMGLMLLR